MFYIRLNDVSRFNNLLVGLCLGLLVSCAGSDSGWKPLFDGESLSGWTTDRLADSKCYVEDKSIVGEITRTMYYLRTVNEYGNFILELEFKADTGVNSGVQIRSDFLKEDKTCIYVAGGEDLKAGEKTFRAGEFSGYQIEIETTDRSWCGGFYEQCGRGWLQPMNHNEPSRKALRQNDWNHLRIIVNKDHFQSWLNGAAATDFHDGNAATGYIAFQIHNSGDPEILGRKIRFRNIMIKEL